MPNFSYQKYLTTFVIAILILLTLLYISGEYQPARYHALLCADKNAAPDGNWHHTYDGYFIGADGCLYNPETTNIADVPPIIFFKQATGNAPIWYVNGINHRIEWVTLEMQLLSRNAGQPVIGIYNATKGGRIADAITTTKKNSKVADTLAATVAQNAAKGNPIFIHANSQGALYTSQALEKALEALSMAFNDKNFQKLVAQIHIETAAAVTASFPPGPKYIHYVNEHDPIPKKAGVLSNQTEQTNQSTSNPGTVIARFSDRDTDPIEPKYHWVGPLSKRFIRVHGFNIYLKHRQPFEELHQQGNGQVSNIIDIP